MGRKKLPMKLISKKRARLVCFEKRKKGLKKAAYELSTLCGVDIGMIIYDPDSNESEICGSLARMVQLYESSSAPDRRCKAYSVAEYIKEEREKAKKKRDKEGRDECGRLSLPQLRELGEFLDARIGAVRGKISLMKAAEADHHVFLNRQAQQKPMFWGNSSLIKAEADDHVFLNQDQQQTMFWGNSSLIKAEADDQDHVFLNQDQQQTMFWGNSSLMQQNLYVMADDVYGVMQDSMMIPETNSQLDINQDYEGSFWGNSRLMQETFFSSNTEQQQIDLCNNMQDSMIPETNSQLDINQDYEGSFWGNSRLMHETFFSSNTEQQKIDICNNMQDLVNPTMMNQSVCVQNFMPGVIQQQWQTY